MIYTPGKPEEDITLKDQDLDDNKVVSSLRRRGISIDGNNVYKRDLCGVEPIPLAEWLELVEKKTEQIMGRARLANCRLYSMPRSTPNSS